VIEINETNFKRLMNLWWLSLILVIVAAFFENEAVISSVETSLTGTGVLSEDILGILAFVLILGLVVSGVLLHRLRIIGRQCFLIVQVISIIFTGLAGYQLLSPFLYAIDGINMMLGGAILMLAYTPQGSQLFVQKVSG
jgi:hypothetical protein